LLVYGIAPPGRRRVRNSIRRSLQPALSLHSRVSLVRTVHRGATVSYGHTFTAPRAMRLATVSAGYGDGYPRAASGRAQVLVQGRRCPVIGRVPMDQTVIDVSAVPAVAPGDAVTLLGSQDNETITAVQLADWCATIPWEILTGISYRVPRVYRGAQAS
jgi:alanine racemase